MKVKLVNDQCSECGWRGRVVRIDVGRPGSGVRNHFLRLCTKCSVTFDKKLRELLHNHVAEVS